MGEVGIYDVASDVDGIFSSEFRTYVRDENLLCRRIDIQNNLNWLFNKEQQKDDVDFAVFDLLNKLMALGRPIGWKYLVQFWKLVTGVDDFGGKRFILSTSNQPFLIEGRYQVSKNICLFRMKMVDIEIGDGGVIGRVFRNKRIEFTPNIGYYSYEEYPLRDLALSCGKMFSLAIPLSDCSGKLVGVLEMVSNTSGYTPIMSCLAQASQQGSSLKYLDHCKHLHGQYKPDYRLLDAALSEIDEVMKVVGASPNLLGAQTWILCNHCASLSISKSLPGMHHTSYENDFYLGDQFFEAEYVSSLKMGEGIVGKAATCSHDLVYCDNVFQFSITEYPLAHIVRDHGLTSCLAIRLKSKLSPSQIYVVELFLSQSEVNKKGLKATLISILEKMMQKFQTFKVASGEETNSERSYVHLIDAKSPHEYQTVKICDLNADSSHQPPVLEYVQTEENVERKSGIPMCLEDLKKVSHMNRKEAAANLGVSISTLKRVCREFDIPRWSRKKKDSKKLSGPCTPAQTASRKEDPARTVQNQCPMQDVSIKAKYGEIFIKFLLSSASGIDVFHEKVKQRLKLEAETYTIEFQDDDNDRIQILCDDDLQEYVHSSILDGKTNLTLYLENNAPVLVSSYMGQ